MRCDCCHRDDSPRLVLVIDETALMPSDRSVEGCDRRDVSGICRVCLDHCHHMAECRRP